MRIEVFEDGGPLDVQAVPFPWKPEVEFNIRRAGNRDFARASENGQPGYMAAIRAVAKKEKLTLKQLHELTGAEIQAKVEELEVDEAIDLTDTSPPNPAHVALHLVESIGEGLLYSDGGQPLGWHESDGDVKHAGVYFLEQSPDQFTAWILVEAQRIETEFQKFMEAAAGNSPTTSADSEAGVEAGA